MTHRTADAASLESRVLAYVNRSGYQPVKPKVLAKKLKLDADGERELRQVLKKLAKAGKLAWGEKHLVKNAEAARDGRVTGVFRRMEGGFGFVRPAGTPLSAEKSHDIFIPGNEARDAASGDVVLVKIRKRAGRKGQPEGSIEQVLERETHRFVGTYFEEGGQGFVQVDGTLFSQPIPVGDPGAKNAQADDKVVFEMVRFPSHAHDGEGVLVEVLGPRGRPGVDTLSVLREFDLPDEFADDALAEARAAAEAFDETNLAGRLDLTGETIITIDPVDARDFDDAISLQRIEHGHWRLGVHIADVGHFVPPRSALDREAFDRGNSTYLPDRVVPMLPEIISNSLASLQPDRVRFTKTVFIEFTEAGARVASEVHNSAILSKRRFSYEEVDDFLAHREAWRKKLSADVHRLLSEMHELAMMLRERRHKRGSLELHLDEVKIDLDKEGRVAGAHVVVNTESHQIIEEFMLAANEAVAELLTEGGWRFLRRNHASPAPRKLNSLTAFVKELGLKTGDLTSRFELQKLLDAVVHRPEHHAVHYAVLRSLPQASYGPQPDGHFALAAEHYCHFTSPIRRYPDLTIHRQVDDLLAGKRPLSDTAMLMAAGVHCSERERRSEAAERTLVKLKLLAYMQTRLGTELDAVITGVESFGMFARGIELPAEGLIHVSTLDDDFYQYDRAAHALEGRRAGNQFRLGDRVRVQVVHVDLERRELDFKLLGKSRSGPAKRDSAKRDATKRPAARPRKRPSKAKVRPTKSRGGQQKRSRR